MRQDRIELRWRDSQRARKMISNLEGPHQSVSHAGGYYRMTYALSHKKYGKSVTSLGRCKWLKYDRRGDAIIWRWFLSSLCFPLPNPSIHHLNYIWMTRFFLPLHTHTHTHTRSLWEKVYSKLCGRSLLSANLVTQPHGVTLLLDWWRLSMSHHSATHTHTLLSDFATHTDRSITS